MVYTRLVLRSSKLLCAFGVIAALSAVPPAPTLRMAAHVDHIDVLAREPMVVELPDGALFASGYGSEHPALWKSLDHGATWNRVDVGTTEDGAIGNSDVDLAVAPDGTLYYVNLLFDRVKKEGTQIAVGVSHDSGGHWTWRTLSKSRFDDRPWVVVASDGAVHVIWNEGKGVLHSTSRDGGGNWTEPERIAAKGGSSHLAAGPNRLIAARITPGSANGSKFDPGIEQIAVSTDGGTSWSMHDAPGERKWTASDDFPPRWVEPVAWDDDGKLYSFWTNDHELWLARSVNRGETWKTWKLEESKESAYYPYLVGHGRGELACTWFSGRDDAMLGHAAMIVVGAGDEPPRFVEATPFQIEAYGIVDGIPTRSTGGEYFGIVFLRSGGFGVVSPVQHTKDRRLGFAIQRQIEWLRNNMAKMSLVCSHDDDSISALIRKGILKEGLDLRDP